VAPTNTTPKTSTSSTSTTTSTDNSNQPAQPTPPTPTGNITGVANGSNKGTKVDLQASYAALMAGLLQYYQPTDTFPLQGGSMTRDELVAQFKAFIDAAEQTKTANTQWRAAVQNERSVETQVAPLRAGVRRIVQARFGVDGVQLLDFGFKQKKVTQKSAATKAAAVVKLRATRAARGTKGSVQKSEVKGNVAGVVITPVTSTLSTEAPAQQPPAATTPAPAAAPAAQPASPKGGNAQQ